MSLVNFELSHDELAWLLLQLRMPPRLGMGDTLYPPGSDPAVVEARLAAGALALQARDWAQITPDNQVILGDLPLAALGATAMAQTAALITVDNDGDQNIFAYYFTDDIAVEHRRINSGVHGFTIANSWDDMVNTMLDHLGLANLQPARVSPCSVSGATADAVLAAAAEGSKQTMHDLLREARVNATIFRHLPDLLLTWQRRVVISMMASAEDETGQKALMSLGTLMVFASPNGAVALEYMPDADGNIAAVGLKPYSADVARGDLSRLTAPLPI